MCLIVLVTSLAFVLVACEKKQVYARFEGDDLLKNATVKASENSDSIKNLTDGKSSKWTTKNKNSYIEVAFNTPTAINTIVMSEPTDSAKLYEIYYLDAQDNSYKMIYRQDRIDLYRMCTFEDIVTEKIKIVFLDFDKKLSISSLEAYYIKNNANKFARQAYIIPDYTLKDIENPDFITSLNLMTDLIIVSGCSLTEQGNLTYEKEKLSVYIEKIREVTNGNVKVHVMVGTGLKPEFKANNKAIVNVAKKHLEVLKSSLKQFIDDVNPDGIDYDWEYPQLAWEWSAYNKILIATKGVIKGRQLSVALWPYGVGLSKEAKACIDRVNAMAYDQFDERGDHSSIYECGVGAIEYFMNKGFSKNQILLGLPFYGRTTDKAAQWPSYDKSYGKWENYLAEYTYTDKDGTYNSSVYVNSYATIRDKVALSIAYNIGGIMIWHFGAGLEYSYEYSLDKAVEFTLQQRLAEFN